MTHRALTLLPVLPVCPCARLPRTCVGSLQRYKKTDTIHFAGESKGWTLGNDGKVNNEKFMGKYSMGEARLVEMLESVCKGKDEKCFAFLSDYEEAIEEWWAELGDGDVAGIEKFLCIENSKVCCGAGTWGKDCSQCLGGAKKPCTGHGSCNGDGVRTGSGKCKCDDGWSGKKCNKCKKGHFLAAAPSEAEAGDIQSCKKCDSSCSECFGPGADGCDKCAAGYAKDGEGDAGPCVEVDECAAEKNPCEEASAAAVVAGKPAQFCKNLPGSFECSNCHAACDAAEGQLAGAGVCTGPTAADCSGRCKDGYQPLAGDSGGCKDVDECAAGHECATGMVCQNNEGGVECAACDSSCSDEGCTGTGPTGCVSCKSGYETKEGKCENIDECRTFPCKGAEDCVDDDGSYDCSCNGPNTSDAVDGTCIRPDKYGHLQTLQEEDVKVQALRKLVLPDVAKGVYSGTAEVGSSDLASKGVNVDFPADLFAKAPAIAKLKGNGVCCGDTFNFTYTSLTKSGFTILAIRSDSQSGWGQKVKVDWEVVDSSATALETRTAELVVPTAEEAGVGGSTGLGLEIVEDLKGNGEANGVRVRVKKGGVAEASGKVQDGDKLLSVNGVALRHASYETVIKACSNLDKATLILTPDPSPLPVVQNDDGGESGSGASGAADGASVAKDEL